jgi:hypothetical protein
MRQLKALGLNSSGLKTFYCSNICINHNLCFPAWYSLLSKQSKAELEKIQRSATRYILPDSSYSERLELLNLTTVGDFISELACSHFNKILANQSHPLFSKITANTNRTSSRVSCPFKPARARTEKRSNSFFSLLYDSF